MNAPDPSPALRPPMERFPIPLVGTVAILLVLIVFTPILFSSGPPAAGSFQTQALLVVDELAPGSNFAFYVHAVGSTIRYATISLGFAAGFPWTSACPTTGLTWGNWHNATNTLADNATTTANPVVVSVTAVYQVGSSSANYSAIVALDSAGGSVAIVSCFGTTPATATEPVAGMPFVLLLTVTTSGGAP